MKREPLNARPSAADLESTLFELRCATNIVEAVQIAMTEGVATAEFFTDALCGAVLYLKSVQEHFSEQIFVGGDE